MTKKKEKKRRRSAETGKFVTEEEVREHPDTTVTETVKPK
jgi:predicted transcriptional regulator